jgi:hypothetical protein
MRVTDNDRPGVVAEEEWAMLHASHCSKFALALSGLFTQLLVGTARAAELTPGNLLVTVSDLYTLSEYTPAGGLVQSLTVPYPVPPRPPGEVVRDILVTPSGSVAVYNGTFDPYMSRWTPATGDWTHDTYEGWSTANLVSWGGIGAWNNYVYVTDTATYGEPADEAKGIVRVDTATGTAARYIDYVEFIDVTAGFDGNLYALQPNETLVYQIDPQTMTVERGFWLGAACHGIAVNAAGEIFGASGDGHLYEFNWLGQLQNTIDPGVGNLTDVDLDGNGALVAGSREGWVVVSHETLQSVSAFRAAYYLPTFVSFTTPVPEPASLVAVLLGFALVLRRR